MENLSKADNYRLYQNGFYGNKLRTWESVKELVMDDSLPPRVVMRYKGAGGGAQYPSYGVPLDPDKAYQMYHHWVRLGAEREKIVFNENAPDDYLTIQGEVVQTENHLALFWSDEKTTMRKAMANGKQDFGLRAQFILKQNLNSNSYEDVMELLDLFPNHVVEFSSYSKNLGSAKARNTIIWEIRKY